MNKNLSRFDLASIILDVYHMTKYYLISEREFELLEKLKHNVSESDIDRVVDYHANYSPSIDYKEFMTEHNITLLKKLLDEYKGYE